VQPAYLCLTDNQGGFPRTGFVLDGREARDLHYVDLHRRSALTGRPGAIDQIFPHELLHIILRDLAGEARSGPASQVHAIGVATDRVTALNEGFAEHAQVMAIDAHDAVPETAAIARDLQAREAALKRFSEYERALTARWSLVPRARMTFPFWFSQSEQVLRYHGVHANLFAHEPAADIRSARSPYDAYLLDNTLPGAANAPRRPLSRLISTEGVVSTLFVHWATSAALQRGYADERFYARFGLRAEDVEPADNVYLKLFAAMQLGSHDVLALVRVYSRLFPADRDAVAEVMREVLGTTDPDDVSQVWVANGDAPHGLSLFDQFRAVRRVHTFDLNAASLPDLVGVPGVDSRIANAILAHAPYSSVSDLARVSEVDGALQGRFDQMAARMRALRASGVDDEGALSLRVILMPYLWRALSALAACAAMAALVYRRVVRVRWWRAAINGTAVAVMGLLVGWTIDPGTGQLSLALPVALFGVPAAMWRGWRSRSPRAFLIVLAAWTAAALVPALFVRPIG
jgi:DNA uptake protein ComE-like DNA-binding protein